MKKYGRHFVVQIMVSLNTDFYKPSDTLRGLKTALPDYPGEVINTIATPADLSQLISNWAYFRFRYLNPELLTLTFYPRAQEIMKTSPSFMELIAILFFLEGLILGYQVDIPSIGPVSHLEIPRAAFFDGKYLILSPLFCL